MEQLLQQEMERRPAPGCAGDAAAEAGAAVVPLPEGEHRGFDRTRLSGCVVFSLLFPLCRGLCAGRDLSAPSTAMPWVVWSR